MNNWFKLAIHYLVAAALIAALIQLSGEIDLQRLTAIHWPGAILGFVASIAANLVATGRWRHCLKVTVPDATPSMSRLFVPVARANVIAMLGLGDIAGMVMRPAMLVARESLNTRAATISVVLERLIDPLLYLAMALPTALYVGGFVTPSEAAWVAIVASGVLLLVSASQGEKFRVALLWMLGVAERTARYIVLQLGRFRRAAKAEGQAEASRILTLELDISTFYLTVLTVVRMALFILRLQLISWAVNVPIPFEIALMSVAVHQVGLMISPTPGALGVAEGGWVMVFTGFGMPLREALLLGLAFRIYITIYTVIAWGIAEAVQLFTGRNLISL